MTFLIILTEECGAGIETPEKRTNILQDKPIRTLRPFRPPPIRRWFRARNRFLPHPSCSPFSTNQLSITVTIRPAKPVSATPLSHIRQSGAYYGDNFARCRQVRWRRPNSSRAQKNHHRYEENVFCTSVSESSIIICEPKPNLINYKDETEYFGSIPQLISHVACVRATGTWTLLSFLFYSSSIRLSPGQYKVREIFDTFYSGSARPDGRRSAHGRTHAISGGSWWKLENRLLIERKIED